MTHNKTHDYTRYQHGIDYVFETIEDTAEGQMTGQGRGIRQGDYLLLKHGSAVEQYEVKTIDYYSSPSDMWIALLIKVKHCRPTKF